MSAYCMNSEEAKKKKNLTLTFLLSRRGGRQLVDRYVAVAWVRLLFVSPGLNPVCRNPPTRPDRDQESNLTHPATSSLTHTHTDWAQLHLHFCIQMTRGFSTLWNKTPKETLCCSHRKHKATEKKNHFKPQAAGFNTMSQLSHTCKCIKSYCAHVLYSIFFFNYTKNLEKWGLRRRLYAVIKHRFIFLIILCRVNTKLSHTNKHGGFSSSMRWNLDFRAENFQFDDFKNKI